MNKELHEKIIREVIEQLKARDIDAYVILTSEGSDHITKFIPGVGTVGSGAFIFTKDDQRYGISTKIDAQDIEESGLFTEVIKYESYDDTVAEVIRRINPKKIALNFSADYPECDGLTMGRYRRFKASLGTEAEFEEVSSDCFIPQIMKRNSFD
jgi:hypothetical protein